MSRLVILLALTATLSSGALLPQNDGLNLVKILKPSGQCPDGSAIPDNDCSAFYECSNGHLIRSHCPDGNLFDSISRKCTLQSKAHCLSQMPNTYQPYSPVGKCPDVQGSYPVYLPDSNKCSIFYECDANGNPIQLACPPGLDFNPVLNVCDWPNNAGCTAGTP